MEQEFHSEDAVTPEQLKAVDGVIDKYRNRPGALILILQEVQQICGYLPPQIQHRIAECLSISPAEVYSVVTFYSFFTMIPRGKYVVRVCTGTACFVCGSEQILSNLKQHLSLEPGQTSADKKYTLEEVRCLGACGLAPVVMINEKTIGNLDPGRVIKAIDNAVD